MKETQSCQKKETITKASSCTKKTVLLLAAILIGSSFLTGCTGDEIIGNKEALKVQSSVTMDESNINALAGGKIADIMVSEGNTIKKGDVILKLDCDMLQAQLSQAQAGLKRSQAVLKETINGASAEELRQLELNVQVSKSNLESAKAAYELEQGNNSRYHQLYDAGSLAKVELDGADVKLESSKTAYENAKSALSIAESKLQNVKNGASAEQIAQVQASVEQAQASIDLIEINIKNSTLTSPVDGVVTSLNVKEGDLVSSGMPVAVVTATQDPYINCNIDETDLSKVELNQNVKISLMAYPNESFDGTIVKINKNADFATKKASTESGFDIRSYGVKVQFKDETSVESKLKCGMTVYVDFEV